MELSYLLTGLVFLLGFTSNCVNSERIAHLEKRNQELQTQITKERATAADFDLTRKVLAGREGLVQ
jgi:hypothetical protein